MDFATMRASVVQLNNPQRTELMENNPSIHLEPDPIIELYKRDIDLTLVIENLRLSVEERFVKLMRLQQFAEELRRAGRQMEARQ